MSQGEANVWRPRVIPDFNKNSKVVPERFVATADQQLFVLTEFTYSVGLNALTVYINGLRKDLFVDYSEVSSSSFSLVAPASAGDIVVAVGQIGIETELPVEIPSNISAITEQQTLSSGQVVVPFTADLSTGVFYILGDDADGHRLIPGTDYTIELATKTVTLADSYPAGTVLLMAYADQLVGSTNMVGRATFPNPLVSKAVTLSPAQQDDSYVLSFAVNVAGVVPSYRERTAAGFTIDLTRNGSTDEVTVDWTLTRIN